MTVSNKSPSPDVGNTGTSTFTNVPEIGYCSGKEDCLTKGKIYCDTQTDCVGVMFASGWASGTNTQWCTTAALASNGDWTSEIRQREWIHVIMSFHPHLPTHPYIHPSTNRIVHLCLSRPPRSKLGHMCDRGGRRFLLRRGQGLRLLEIAERVCHSRLRQGHGRRRGGVLRGCSVRSVGTGARANMLCSCV